MGRNNLAFFLFIFIWGVTHTISPAFSNPAKSTDNDLKTIAIEDFGELHYRSDRLRLSLRERTAELFGNVRIVYGDQCLYADYAQIFQETGRLIARGNIRLEQPDLTITATEIDYNLTHRTGIILDGRVSNEKYSLAGERIEKITDRRFRASRGEYSTCLDCPKSWTLYGNEFDFEIEGYAHISGMMVRVNEVPLFYFPYLVFPVKTERQSGLLLPRIGSSEDFGFRYIQPYYWAISHSQDATFYGGHYSKRGWKLGAEYRFVMDHEGHGGIGEAWAINDRKPLDPEKEAQLRPYSGWRWGTNWNHQMRFAPHLTHRLRWRDVSDASYLRQFSDVPGRGESALTSIADLTYDFSPLWVNFSVFRHRSLLAPLDDDPTERNFPRRTVQVYPEVNFAVQRSEVLPIDQNIGFWFEGTATWTRFDRDFEPWEDLPSLNPQGDPVRAARVGDRLVLEPQLSLDTRLFDRFVFRPSIIDHRVFYRFDLDAFEDASHKTQTHWPLLRIDLETTFDRIYWSERERVIGYLHEFTPRLRFDRIFHVGRDEDHPFYDQVQAPGGAFDEFDFIPLSGQGATSQVSALPLENTLTLQLNNRLIRKRLNEKDLDEFSQIVDWNISQAVDMKKARSGEDFQDSLSQLRSLLRVNQDSWRLLSDSTYYHDTHAKVLSKSLFKSFASYGYDIYRFERSIGLNYAYNDFNRETPSETVGFRGIFSFTDYLATQVGGNYSITNSQWYSWGAQIRYTDRSRCWEIAPALSWERDTRDLVFTFNLAINLTGGGLLSLTDVYGT